MDEGMAGTNNEWHSELKHARNNNITN